MQLLEEAVELGLVTKEQMEDSFRSLQRPGTGSQSLTSQVVFGSCVRPSASLDSLGTLYDSHWSRQRPSNRRVKRAGGEREVGCETFLLSRPVHWVSTCSVFRGRWRLLSV